MNKLYFLLFIVCFACSLFGMGEKMEINAPSGISGQLGPSSKFLIIRDATLAVDIRSHGGYPIEIHLEDGSLLMEVNESDLYYAALYMPYLRAYFAYPGLYYITADRNSKTYELWLIEASAGDVGITVGSALANLSVGEKFTANVITTPSEPYPGNPMEQPEIEKSKIDETELKKLEEAIKSLKEAKPDIVINNHYIEQNETAGP